MMTEINGGKKILPLGGPTLKKYTVKLKKHVITKILHFPAMISLLVFFVFLEFIFSPISNVLWNQKYFFHHVPWSHGHFKFQFQSYFYICTCQEWIFIPPLPTPPSTFRVFWSTHFICSSHNCAHNIVLWFSHTTSISLFLTSVIFYNQWCHSQPVVTCK